MFLLQTILFRRLTHRLARFWYPPNHSYSLPLWAGVSSTVFRLSPPQPEARIRRRFYAYAWEASRLRLYQSTFPGLILIPISKSLLAIRASGPS